jgi:H+/Cl- antiporter ClcA
MTEKNSDLDFPMNGRERPAAWWLFNLFWWLSITVVSYVYLDLSEPLFRHISPWYLWLMVTAGIFLSIHALLFWLVLKTIFHRRKNSRLVTVMSVLVFAGFLTMVVISLLMGFPALKT